MDDILATGGTVSALLDMIDSAGAIPIGVAVFPEVIGFPAHQNFEQRDVPVQAVIGWPEPESEA